MARATSRQPALPVRIDLTLISTPCEVAITATIGNIDPSLIETAIEARIRSLPVLDAAEKCLGTIEVQRLTQLVANNQPLTVDAITHPCQQLPHLVPVHTLLDTLVEQGVVIHAADPEVRPDQSHWFGIVSTADLNRPIFRAHIYLMLVILETSLGQLIMDDFGDDWGAIHLLSEHTQHRIQDFYNEERAEGIDLSPVTNATLSDLFHIAVSSHRIWNLMGFDHPNELQPVAQRINNLRNTIMHPVRPLIVNEHELHDVATGVQHVEHLTRHLMERTGIVVS